jgi:hypothetical protein
MRLDLQPLKNFFENMKYPTFAFGVFVCAWLSAVSLSQANAQTPVQKSTPVIKPSAANPIRGQWSWKQFDGSCNETLRYQGDGELLAVSATSISKWTYQISKSPSAAGFYRVLETLISDNGKADCAGNLLTAKTLAASAKTDKEADKKADQEANTEDRTRSRFIQLSPAGNLLLLCSEESLKACFGPLTKEPGDNW